MTTQSPSSKFATAPFPLITTPAYTQLLQLRKQKTSSHSSAPDANAHSTTPLTLLAPSDPEYSQFIEAASTMALMHNAIIRGLNSIYLQAPYVKEGDRRDFLGYALCWVEVLDAHHTSEEEGFFPKLEQMTGEKGLMDGNIEQHHAFLPGLTAYKTHLQTLLSTPSSSPLSYSGTHIQALINAFAPLLTTHLQEEIPSLLSLSRFGSSLPLGEIMRTEGRKSGERNSKTGGSMFFFRNLDLGFEEGLWSAWPPIPWAVRWVLVRAFGAWNRGWWRFASCDLDGKMVELYALRDVGHEGESLK